MEKAKKPKKVKKITKKYLEKVMKREKTKAWGAVSLFVRTKENGVCYTCGVKKEISETHCGHYRHNTERNRLLGGNKLWFDTTNLHCQCTQCNLFHSGRLDQYAIHLERDYGNGILQTINNLYNTYKLWTIDEIIDVTKRYKVLLELLREARK